ncbi:MAG: MmgE/PrpD family protein [Burkholderiales bacterium]|nr:MmgE/PrpD family protein [Burkholderiales bacterium]
MYAKTIADYVASMAYADLPAAVIAKAKDCVRDYLGSVLGAYPVRESRLIAEWVRDLGDRSEATVLGWGFRTSARSAALANGYFAEVLETQDGTSYGNNHPASVIQPAVLAAAEHMGASGREAITAIVAGYEVMNRVAASLPGEQSLGSMKTGTTGTIAAAAAVAKLLGLDATGIVNAMGISGFIVPLSMRENMWGPTVKPLLGGQAAMAGIQSALLAAKGFTGCEEIFKGTAPRFLGFCNLLSTDPVFDKLTERLGERYTILDVYYKPYAACRLSHSALEAALALVQEHAIAADAVEAIEVKTFARAARELGRYPEPDSSFIVCQFSLPYMLAVVLADKTIGPAQYRREKIADPAIQALSRKVRVLADETMSKSYPATTPARVRITLRSGKTFEKQVERHKWEPERGIPREELMAKFRELAGACLPREQVETLARTVDALDELASIAPLIRQAVI